MGRKILCFAIILFFASSSYLYSDTREIIKDGITGAGAGAVGSAIGKDNMLGAAAAGAGVNIVGGVLLDSLLNPKPPQPVYPEPKATVIREKDNEPSPREVVYIDRQMYHYDGKLHDKPKPKGRKLGHYKKNTRYYDDGWREGQEIGYLNGWKDAFKNMQGYCKREGDI